MTAQNLKTLKLPGTQTDANSVAIAHNLLVDQYAGNVSQNNLNADRAPLPTDDETLGFVIGSLWCDVVGYNVYVCDYAGAGDAKWHAFGHNCNVTATRAPGVFDDSTNGDNNTIAPGSFVPLSPGGDSTSGLCCSSNGAVIYAGISTSGAIQKSIDNGATWNNISVGLSFGVAQQMSCSDSGTVVLLVDINHGLYVSIDGGASWSRPQINTNWQCGAVSSNGSILAAVRSGVGLYISVDSGANWTFNSALGTLNTMGCAISSDGAIIYVVYVGSPNGMKKSSDGGTSWNTVLSATTGMLGVSCSANGQHVYGMDSYSHDSGGSFTPIGGSPSSTMGFPHISNDGNIMCAWILGNGSIQLTTDGGPNFRNDGLFCFAAAMSSDGAYIYTLKATAGANRYPPYYTDVAVRKYYPAEVLNPHVPFTACKSTWYWAAENKLYICIKDAPGAAEWIEVYPQGITATGSSDGNLDGGTAASIYLLTQKIDGGTA